MVRNNNSDDNTLTKNPLLQEFPDLDSSQADQKAEGQNTQKVTESESWMPKWLQSVFNFFSNLFSGTSKTSAKTSSAQLSPEELAQESAQLESLFNDRPITPEVSASLEKFGEKEREFQQQKEQNLQEQKPVKDIRHNPKSSAEREQEEQAAYEAVASLSPEQWDLYKAMLQPRLEAAAKGAGEQEKDNNKEPWGKRISEEIKSGGVGRSDV